jgi:CelD/BcsL family acetyltransferase involved in cellulose biosynthesis
VTIVQATTPVQSSTARPRDCGPAPIASSLSLEVIKNFDLLEDYVERWEDLASNALEPNPFYEPWMLIPALRALARGTDVRVVLVVDRHKPGPALCGVFPIERRARYRKLPAASFRLWQHIYCALCTPLIRAGSARATIEAFADWVASQGDASLMEFNQVSGDGPFAKLLDCGLRERGTQTLAGESYSRALFLPRGSADSYIRAALRRDHRKDLKRRRRRLSEQGRLEFDSLEAGGDVNRWLNEFLELEAGGWKQHGGGAFACNESNRDYFVTVATGAFERNRLMMLALRLDGKPIAMKCNILAGPGSFAFKIAFDENFSYYSPGVLLELENIRCLHEDPRVEWMDSCASPEHPMIDRLWHDRRLIKSVLASTGRAGDLLITALPLMRSINRKVRAMSLSAREESR